VLETIKVPGLTDGAEGSGSMTFLRVETDNENIEIPPFLQVAKEVTGVRKYSSHSLAIELNNLKNAHQ